MRGNGHLWLVGLLISSAVFAADSGSNVLNTAKQLSESGDFDAAEAILATERNNRTFSVQEARLFADVSVLSAVERRRFELQSIIKIWKPTGLVQEGQYPWIVSVQLYDKKRRGWVHTCGGVVVASNTVLTAAHCVQVPLESLRVAYGSVNLLSSGLATVSPVSLWQHSEFRKVTMTVRTDGVARRAIGRDNDIGKIVLATSLSIPPVEIQSEASGTSSAEQPLLRVFGWGVSDIDISGRLAFAEVNEVSRGECEKVYSPLAPSMYCGGDIVGKRNFCNGDSGGPLVRIQNGRAALVGIVSFMADCSHPVGVYMRIGEDVASLPWKEVGI